VNAFKSSYFDLMSLSILFHLSPKLPSKEVPEEFLRSL
jgi:hypothetical protein